MLKRIVIWTLLTVLVFVVLALILAPVIAKNSINNNGKEWTGRKIDLKGLSVNYFKASTTLSGFTIYESDDRTPFAEFDTLLVRIKPFKLFKKQVHLSRTYLKGLQVGIVYKDSTFNFNDLIELGSSTSEDESAGDSDEPYKFIFENTECKKGGVTYEQMPRQPVNIEDINFIIPYVAFNEDEQTDAGATFNLANGSKFKVDVRANQVSGEFESDIEIDSFNLRGLSEYVRPYLRIGNLEGWADAEIAISGNYNDLESISVTGAGHAYHFAMSDTAMNPLVEAHQIDIGIQELLPLGNRYIFDSITILEPFFRVEYRDSILNIAEIYIEDDGSADNAEEIKAIQDTTNIEESSDDLYYRINVIRVTNGKLDFFDYTPDSVFEYHLSRIQFDVDSVSDRRDWVIGNAKMLLNERGKLNADLGFDPSNPLDFTVDFVITDFELIDLNIYSVFYVGYPIILGDMYYKGHTENIDNILTSENQLVIRDAELGPRKKGLMVLPIKLAIAILKDKYGIIRLDIPVSGNLDDPEIDMGKLIWSTLKDIIFRAATKPSTMLGTMVGAKPEDLESIEFNYLDTALTERHKYQLEKLLEIEALKDQLQIKLVYYSDRDIEKQEYALKHVTAQYNSYIEKKRPLSEKEFPLWKFVIEQLPEADTSDLSAACVQIIGETEADYAIQQMDSIRSVRLVEYLNSVNDSTLILIESTPPERAKNTTSKPRFEVQMVLREEADETVWQGDEAELKD